jgi:hypothetical protein
MMKLRHGWGLRPPQTASHIHIWQIQSVWAHWYAVHRYTLALHSNTTHPPLVKFWGSGSGSLVESQSDVIMSWLRLTANSNSFHYPYKTYKSVWAHWYAVHRHTVAALHSYTHPYLAQMLGFWVTYGCGVKMMWLRHETDSHLNLLPLSIQHIYKVFEHIEMLSIGIW